MAGCISGVIIHELKCHPLLLPLEGKAYQIDDNNQVHFHHLHPFVFIATIVPHLQSSQGFSSGNETLGFLQVGFRENKLYYVTTEEVNALSMASTIGSLGGFWQYILIAWGFFFISKEPENKIKIARRLGKLEEHLGWLKEEKGQGEVTIASEGARSSSQNTPRNKKELEDHTVLQQGEVPLSSHDVHPSNMAEV
ncbi:unnamed protein product [Choristocarpus tenellus]